MKDMLSMIFKILTLPILIFSLTIGLFLTLCTVGIDDWNDLCQIVCELCSEWNKI